MKASMGDSLGPKRVLPAIGITVILLLVGWQWWLHDRSTTDENHYFENLQAMFLIAAAVSRMRQRQMASSGELRICLLTLSLLCFSVLIRELDIDKFGSSPIWAMAENVIRLAALMAWVLVWVSVFRMFSSLWLMRRRVFLSSCSFATATAIGFYIAACFFDQRHVPVEADVSQLIEEALQLCGAASFFVGALFSRKLILESADAAQSSTGSHFVNRTPD